MTALKHKLTAAFMAAASLVVAADGAEPVRIDYRADLTANTSSGAFAPYMIGSWNYGKYTAGKGIWQSGMIGKKISTATRFSWGAGLEYIAGYGSAASYDRYDAASATWSTRDSRLASARIQQLFAEIKFRGVYLTVGMKERNSLIVDGSLSSGDITRSNNSRPIPGVAAGFIDFQNIPFTNGWVQIDGEIMYGRFMDNKYRKETFNHYTGLLSTDNWYIYRRCYFRTKPSQPFSVTVGMQAAGEFAGYGEYYRRGKVEQVYNRGFKAKDIFTMFFPREGTGEGFYKGNSLGSWDFKARYRFRNESELSAYFEWPWEDGSGIGKATGWDGLWGLQYDFKRSGVVEKVVVEYFDFTNMSGPIHYAPSDSPGATITSSITGGDNYYNNDFYGPYSNYGMSIGSPFVVSPLYNRDGYPQYSHNRARGFHAAVQGSFAKAWEYTVMTSYQQAGGSGRLPAPRRLHDTSAKISAKWKGVGGVPGLDLRAEVAFDAGKLRGDNFGALVGVSYSGFFNIGKK